MRRALLFSLLTHLLATALALVSFAPALAPQAPKITPPHVVTLAFRGVTRSSGAAGPRRGTRRPRPSISQLGIPMDLEPRAGSGDVGWKFGLATRGGHRVDLAREARTADLFQYIHHSIDNSLTYPSELKAADIEGSVDATIVFSPSGEFLERESRLAAGSSFLRVHVIRTLRNAFRQPIPATKRKSAPGKLEVNAKFAFRITYHDEESVKQTGRSVLANELRFYRNFAKSALAWQVGPLVGLGPAAGLDVLWFVKKIGDALSHKAKIDPLDLYRNDPSW